MAGVHAPDLSEGGAHAPYLQGPVKGAVANELKAAGVAKLELAFLTEIAAILEEIRTALHLSGITN